jgi:hypothetical protein
MCMDHLHQESTLVIPYRCELEAFTQKPLEMIDSFVSVSAKSMPPPARSPQDTTRAAQIQYYEKSKWRGHKWKCSPNCLEPCFHVSALRV